MREESGGAAGVGSPAWKRAAQVGHVALARLLFAGVLLQFYSSWLMLAGRPQLHAIGGWVLILGGVFCAATAVVGFGVRGSRAKGAGVLFLLLSAQPLLAFVLAARSPFLGALHPVNGLLVFVLLMRLSRAAG